MNSAVFSEKSERDFSQLPRDLFAKQNFWRKFFQNSPCCSRSLCCSRGPPRQKWFVEYGAE
jgi:hypothetical protein